MSSNWNPLNIPPGVVSMPTKNVSSANWAEVNAVRWIGQEMLPIGGQEKILYSTPFASRIRAIHSWYDLSNIMYTAYVCENNVYVDAGGVLLDITPADGFGTSPSTTLDGYGEGTYGSADYGAPPRPGAVSIIQITTLPPVWSVDNFGALLLVMNSNDGRLLFWDPTGSEGKLTQMENAPNARCFVVTPDRFVMEFGVLDAGGSNRRFAWCNQEDPTDWDYTDVTGQAGFFDLEPASPIITAHAGRSGWVMMFTAGKSYVIRYIGLPFVYAYDEVGDQMTPWSPASITSTSSLMMWVAQQGIYAFDGTSVYPMPCPVWQWVKDDIDDGAARLQAVCVHVGMYSEVWWFFPQKGQPYNTRAIVTQYRDGWWSQCQMARSAGITSSWTTLPIFANGTDAYRHESGVYYNACDLPWTETFPMQVQGGARLATIKQMIADVKGDETQIQYRIAYKNNRLSSSPEAFAGPYSVRPDGYIDTRVTGRDMRLRWEIVGPEVPPITIGQHMIDVVQRGDR